MNNADRKRMTTRENTSILKCIAEAGSCTALTIENSVKRNRQIVTRRLLALHNEGLVKFAEQPILQGKLGSGKLWSLAQPEDVECQERKKGFDVPRQRTVKKWVPKFGRDPLVAALFGDLGMAKT